MKLSEKFLDDLHKIGQYAFVEKNRWVGKLVPEIICDTVQERGINQEDIEGCVCLTVEEATSLNETIEWLCSIIEGYERERDNPSALIEGWSQMDFLENKIEQAKGK